MRRRLSIAAAVVALLVSVVVIAQPKPPFGLFSTLRVTGTEYVAQLNAGYIDAGSVNVTQAAPVPLNGIYQRAPNVLSFAAAGGGKFEVDSNGEIYPLSASFSFGDATTRWQNFFSNGRFTTSVASGSNGIAIETNGGRIDFGAGASDYASSDGTTVSFAGAAAVVGTFNAGNGNFTVNGSTGAITLTGATTLAANTQFKVVNATFTATAPTVTACAGGTAATVTWSNGSAALKFDVGTACTSESTAVITLPTATNCWTCSCWNTGVPGTNIKQSACNTTTATMTNYAATFATATDWTDGADIQCMCIGG